MALPAVIRVYDLKTREKIREWHKPIDRREIKDWLQRMCVWAVSNGYGLEITKRD